MKDNTIFGALAIPYKQIQNGFEFLLLKHQNGIWTFPGGGKDEEDLSLEDCLVRELKEEIGIVTKKSELLPTGLVNRFTYGPEKPERSGKPGETHFWLLKLTGNETLSSFDKIVDYGWFSSEKILELIPFQDERRIFSEACKVLQEKS